MKKGITITLYIIFAIIIIISALTIDYSVAKLYGNRLIFATKKVYEREQYTTYTGILYKMWICNANLDAYKIGKKDDTPPPCPMVVIFDENGNFITDNNITLTEKEYSMISRYYTYELINNWKTRKELEDALYISEELYKTEFATKDGYDITYKNEKYNIAIFYDFILTDNGKYKWEMMENNLDFQYCMKFDTIKNENLFSKFSGTSCEGSFEKIEVSKKLCETIENSIISDAAKYSYDKVCK